MNPVRQPESQQLPGDEILANNLRYSEDGLYFSIDGASFRVPVRQHCAAVGLGNSGKDELAGLVSRLIYPTSGNLTIGETKMQELPEAITGKRLAYVGPTAFMFNGSVYDNLCYSLKHQPVNNGDDAEDAQRLHERHLAEQAGNSPHRYDDDWIDYGALGMASHRELVERTIEILKCVELDEEIYQFGLLSFVDPVEHEDLSGRIM